MRPRQRLSGRWIKRRALAVLLGLVAASAACTDPRPPAGPLEVLPARLSEDGARLIPLSDGDSVELVRPIQGGHVLFIGALLRYPADGDGTLRGELRRVDASGQAGPVIVYDERTTAHQALAADTPAPPAPNAADASGWRQIPPDLTSVANIPVCPDFFDYDLVDAALILRISFKDRAGREAAADRRVKTRCAQTDPVQQGLCRCECQAKYTIDRCFSRPDAGSGDGG
ncbi:MAG: hypothetical protein U1A78_09040 [Polyangia bacterium]